LPKGRRRAAALPTELMSEIAAYGTAAVIEGSGDRSLHLSELSE